MKNDLIIKLWLFIFSVSIGSLYAQKTSNLLFKSSFNYSVIVDKSVVWNHHLSGTDQITAYTFPDDLPGDNMEHYFNYVIGDVEHYFDYANAEVVTTTGQDGNPTNALYIEFIQDDPDFVSYSRVQYSMFGNSLSDDPVQRMNQGYVKYKIKTHLDHDDLESDWRIPIEWKDMDDDGFRVGLYIYDTNTLTPYWVVKGQYMIAGELGDDVWEFENHSIPVTEDDWFDMEVYWYGHPDPSMGQLKVAINNQVLFDVTNQTKDPNQPDKMFYFMPFKVYGAVGYSWITDFEYRNIPPLSSVLSSTWVSVKDEADVSNCIVYPNPTTSFLHLTTAILDGEYQITNSIGQEVQSGILYSQKIDISKLRNEIYFIRIIDQKTKEIHLVKFIKKS